jgi:uncharacterized damage-inducible protein DinB
MKSFSEELLAVYDDLRARLFARLEGLTDDEYLWEPVRGGWSVRPGEDGVFRAEKTEPDPDPAPFTTIAWRLWHIGVECLQVYVTFAFERVEFPHEWPGEAARWPGTAKEAVAALDERFTRFRARVAALDEAALADSAGPLAAGIHVFTYRELLLRAVDEATHHGAEIGLLRDLYRRQAPAG